ncbi:alpha/beta fold hydrolase [Amycolatopsis sp. CA-230715]|uniref:alpha/beta fold hydrolase n=1 Tax=Amycolatopsis sp. CA-230715 TaxID=2745196 RepID=UPI001C00F589|nr:alpha/beta fold hydrolase [Amycolatopsis sp. CA-230715]QWF84632.1 Tripeptidyl aminopeptidase [Amycolatopsis sp. CA-230715]
MRIGVFGTVALLLLVTGCSGDEPWGAADGPVSAVTADLPAPLLHWESCRDAPGLSCADLPVPLDYRHPEGAKISIAVSRLSTGDGHPVLLSNPGGPGASGLFNTLGVDGLTGGALRERFDLIGFDPRGVGRSGGVHCGLDANLVAAAAGGAAPRDFRHDADAASAIASACAAGAGPVLPHLTTANTARDVELLRKALHRERISFVGTSYGAELAVAYASMFPGGTDRVVLDSASDVTVGWRAARREEAAAADARFTEVAAKIAREEPRWHLGTTAGEVRDRYLRTAAELDARPRSIDGSRVDAAVLQEARLLPALRSDDDIAPFALTLAYLSSAPGALSEQDLLAALGPERDAGPLPGGQSAEQNASAFLAVRCGDERWPADTEEYRRATSDEASRFPVTRGQFSKITACAFWPGPPPPARPDVTDRGWRGGPNVLILRNTRDFLAPDEGVTNTRRALGRRAVAISVDDYRHGVLGRSACATGYAVRWLVGTGTPRRDLAC